MKKLTSAALLLVGISAMAADTDAVISCYKRSRGTEMSSAILCANVKSEAEANAVISCYSRAPGTTESASRLCSNVKN